jgi:hypothetical protein
VLIQLWVSLGRGERMQRVRAIFIVDRSPPTFVKLVTRIYHRILLFGLMFEETHVVLVLTYERRGQASSHKWFDLTVNLLSTVHSF